MLQPDSISTRDFKITKNNFSVLRSSNGQRDYSLKKINYLDLTYGSITKNPILTTLFGVGCLSFSAFGDYYLAVHRGYTLTNFLEMGKIGGVSIVIMIFLAVLGMSAIYQTLKSVVVMKVEFSDGKKEIFRLEEIVQRRISMKLLKVVVGNLEKNQIRLNKKLIEDIKKGSLKS